MEKFMKKGCVVFVMSLLLMTQGIGVNAATKVKLTAEMPWVNSDRVNCQQISTYGSVSSASQKKVAWAMEYRGTDGQWHYQKSSDQWDRFNPGTRVPTLTGKLYSRCDQRLQLNPEGSGYEGKGGVATGYMNVVK